MASNSTLAKHMQESNLFKCATTILLMCCYLYRKKVFQPRSQPYQLSYESKAHNLGNNVNTEGKDEVEMQTPIDDSGIFIDVSRSAQAPP